MSDEITVTGQRGAVSNTISVTVGMMTLSGWQNVRLTRSIEHFPSTFQIELTERYPNQASSIVITLGDPIIVKLGANLVLTGYVDTYEATTTSNSHTVRIAGRSKCEDLIDCSAGEAPYQLNNTTLVGLARQLAEPYGIDVLNPDGDSATIPVFNVTLEENGYQILEAIARWANFIVYDNIDGDLLISKVGDMKAASGFLSGPQGNVQSASVNFSMQDRFTEIEAIYFSTGFLLDGSVPPVGSPNPVIPIIPKAQAFDESFPKRADGQPRFRRLLFTSEQSQNSPDLANQRAQWEMARRIGRSQAVRLVCDSWRDSANNLWDVNTLAPLDLPEQKLVDLTWLIATVTFVRDDNGTTAELVLMPPNAFVPEPVNLTPFDATLGRELPGGAGNQGPTAR